MREEHLTLLPYLRLVRPFTLAAPVVGAVSGSAVASFALDVAWPVGAVALAALSAAAATGASNAWNQVFDVEVDRANKPERPLPAGAMTIRAAQRFGDVLAGLSLALAALVSAPFLACVAVGVLATWIYSAPPLRTKRLTWGALLTIAVPRGLLVPVAGWSIVAAPHGSDPWALGVVAGLYVFGAAATKDFADVAGDRAHGCRTLPIVWGAKRASQVVAPFLVAPFLLYPGFGLLGWMHVPLVSLIVLTVVLCGIGLVTARALLRDPDGLARSATGHPAWRGMYLLLLASQVGVVLVYAI